MSDLTNTFSDIGNAIRYKTNTTDLYKPIEMANAINNIETGGTIEPLVLTGPTISLNSRFNYPITIDLSVTNMAYAFNHWSSFSQPVTIPSSVTDVNNCFYFCNSFNAPVTIDNGITNIKSLFERSEKFNQPITIPNSVIYMEATFWSCRNFNSPVIIGNHVKNMVNTFYSCPNFNAPVTFLIDRYNANNLMYVDTFKQCDKFNQDITVNINNDAKLAGFLSNCYNFGSNVTLLSEDRPLTNLNFQYMFERKGLSPSKRVNVICMPSIVRNVVQGGIGVGAGSGGGNVSFTAGNNHPIKYYSPQVNLYVLNLMAL